MGSIQSSYYKVEKGEKIVAYSNGVAELVPELESSGHKISKVEMKRALLKGLIKESLITT